MSRQWLQKRYCHHSPRTNELTEITARKPSQFLAKTRVLSPLSAINSPKNGLQHSTFYQARNFSSGPCSGGNDASGAPASSGGGDEEDDGSSPGDGVGPGGYSAQTQTFPPTTALTAMTIPEVFPNVPIIAVNRNPVFPKLIKFIEVRNNVDTNLILINASLLGF